MGQSILIVILSRVSNPHALLKTTNSTISLHCSDTASLWNPFGAECVHGPWTKSLRQLSSLRKKLKRKNVVI